LTALWQHRYNESEVREEIFLYALCLLYGYFQGVIMVKLVVLYRKPADPAAFDRAYFETHIPLVKKIPHLRRVDIARVTGAPRGEPEFYLMCEMYFDDRAAMDASMASPENAEAGKNLMGFARGLVTFVFAEEIG
jgi:uncharacterized protein (TIGR02118 family)